MPKIAVAPRPRLSAKQGARPDVLLGVPCYSPRHASGITTSRWDVVALIMSTMRAAAMLRNHHACLVEDEEGSRRLGELLMNEIDTASERKR